MITSRLASEPCPERRTSATEPSVSIIVPTFNRMQGLRNLLAALEREHAAGPDFEVVVAVDGSSDGTAEMLSTLRPAFSLCVLQQQNAGPAAARNRAIEAATGDVLLFLDDDVVPDPGLVKAHVATHRAESPCVAFGPMLAPPTGLPAWLHWEAAMLVKQYRALVSGEWTASARQFYTANASVRRQHLLAAGAFDERLRRAEDVELAYRLARRGLRFQFLPEARVLHRPDRSFGSWLHVGYQYGRQDVFITNDCGHAEVLPRAYREWANRRLINRAFTRLCVGHTHRMASVTAAARMLMSSHAPVPRRLQMFLCSALFNMQYWQGIADASGLGSDVWLPPTEERLETAAAIEA